jgi:hypothetical protein
MAKSFEVRAECYFECVGLGELVIYSGVKVAGEASEHELIDLAICPEANFNHFPDIGKMVLHGVTGHLAGGLGLGDHSLKILPFGVAKEVLEIVGKPVFDPILGLLGVGFESVCEMLNEVAFHCGLVQVLIIDI